MEDTIEHFDTMSIETASGEKVIYMGRNGYPSDKAHANTYLKVGETYTVDSMDVGRSSSTVKLVEVPHIHGFNTVMFKNATEDYECYDWFGDNYPSPEKIRQWVKEAQAAKKANQ